MYELSYNIPNIHFSIYKHASPSPLETTNSVITFTPINPNNHHSIPIPDNNIISLDRGARARAAEKRHILIVDRGNDTSLVPSPLTTSHLENLHLGGTRARAAPVDNPSCTAHYTALPITREIANRLSAITHYTHHSPLFFFYDTYIYISSHRPRSRSLAAVSMHRLINTSARARLPARSINPRFYSACETAFPEYTRVAGGREQPLRNYTIIFLSFSLPVRRNSLSLAQLRRKSLARDRARSSLSVVVVSALKCR